MSDERTTWATVAAIIVGLLLWANIGDDPHPYDPGTYEDPGAVTCYSPYEC